MCFFSLLTLAPNRKISVTCCGLFDCHVTFFLTGEIRSVLVEAAAGLSGRTGSLFFLCHKIVLVVCLQALVKINAPFTKCRTRKVCRCLSVRKTGHLQIPKTRFQNEVLCKTFEVKVSFICTNLAL